MKINFPIFWVVGSSVNSIECWPCCTYLKSKKKTTTRILIKGADITLAQCCAGNCFAWQAFYILRLVHVLGQWSIGWYYIELKFCFIPSSLLKTCKYLCHLFSRSILWNKLHLQLHTFGCMFLQSLKRINYSIGTFQYPMHTVCIHWILSNCTILTVQVHWTSIYYIGYEFTRIKHYKKDHSILLVSNFLLNIIYMHNFNDQKPSGFPNCG